MTKKALLAAGAVLAASYLVGPASASAVTIDGGGVVQSWNVTPFSQPNANNVTSGGITSTYQNNYAPIDFPGHGHVPSPGGVEGEKFDLEELHARVVGNQLQVLLVASSLYQASGGGSTFNLGDLMIDVNGDHLFDFGVVTQHGNAGLVAGGLYDIANELSIQQINGSYYYRPAIRNLIGGWAVGSGLLLGTHAVETASHSYPGEANTWVYQFTIDIPALGLDHHTSHMVDLQMSWGCGNDVITDRVEIPAFANPEPATASLGLLALGGIITAVGRRVRRPA